MKPEDLPVPSSHFNVDTLPAKRRFEVWRDSIACIFDVEGERDITSGDVFRATLDMHAVGPVLLARTTTLRQAWERSSLAVARDGMDHYMIQFYDRGDQRVTYRGGTVEMPPRGLLVYDLSQEISARTTDLTNTSLIIPRPLLEGLLRAPDDQHMRALGENEPLVAILRDHMRSVADHGHRLSVREGMELGPVMVGLAAACLNASLAETPGGAAAVSHATLTGIKREIEARLDDPELTPADLCRRFRISRTRLYELFEPLGGVGRYVRDRRLRKTLLALLDPAQDGKTIYQIGYDAGFYDESTFSRTFRKRYGFSPRDARREAMRGHGPGHALLRDAALDRRYEQWLHELAPTA